MSGRGATSAVQAQITAEQNRVFHLFELYLSGVTVRVTDFNRPITWGGNTYEGLGVLLDYEGIDESLGLQVQQIKIRLNVADPGLISAILQYHYIGRRVVVRKAFADSDWNLIIDPVPIFDGRVDVPEINENPDDGTCIMTLYASSHLIDFERVAGRHTNHAETQVYFPGDKGFEYADQLAGREITWGAASQEAMQPDATGVTVETQANAMTTSVQTQGWAPNSTVLYAGTHAVRFGAHPQYYELQEDVITNSQGKATVSLAQPLTVDAKAGDVVTWMTL